MSGYVLITSYLAITELPIIIATIDEGVKKAKAENKKKEKVKAREGFRDPGAWNAWFVTLVFNIFFIIMYHLNYPDSEIRGTVNSVLILGINLPWTLVCVRNYLVVPDHMAARIYCIVFDCMVTKDFFRNHVILVLCSVMGFQYTYFFTLMLLDIFSISSMLRDIIKCLTMPGAKLAMVFFLFMCTFVIYATFGLAFFENELTYEDDTGCHSVIAKRPNQVPKFPRQQAALRLDIMRRVPVDGFE